MSHSTTYFPCTIRVHGKVRTWRPTLGCFIGNHQMAAKEAARLRTIHPKKTATVRRFGGHVNVYL
jgi:hypothetical protein